MPGNGGPPADRPNRDATGWLQQVQACSNAFRAGARELEDLINQRLSRAVQFRLATAVPCGLGEAERLQATCLLLSPACASFDQYRDFEARGDHFRHLVEQQRSAIA